VQPPGRQPESKRKDGQHRGAVEPHIVPHAPQLFVSSSAEHPKPGQHLSVPEHSLPLLQVHVLFVHPSEVRVEHESAQPTLCPQLFVTEPQGTLLQSPVLFGVQHVLFARHTPAFGHVAGHGTGCPQLFIAVVLHTPLHAFVLSGVQQLSLTHTWEADEQFAVPPAPQLTLCPQLFVEVPHVLPMHVVVTGSGTHPHDPLVHVSPASQPPQSIGCPQLSMLGPHRFWHDVESAAGAQHESLARHTPPSPHVAEHVTGCPHRFMTVVLHLPAHTVALSGVQHVPSLMQTSPLDGQDVDPAGPQETIWPQLFVADPQFFPAHVCVVGSGVHPPHVPFEHVAPPSQPPQSTVLLQLSNCIPQRLAQ